MRKIDAHAHVLGNVDALADILATLDLKMLNVAVPRIGAPWRERSEASGEMARKYPDRFAWCTGFDLPDFADGDYAEKVIAGLADDFARGAVACKVWKNIGMELTDAEGKFVQIDHDVFRPIFDYLEAQRRPVIAHLGEPLECWLPLDENSVHYGYYSRATKWHMYGRDNFPSHADITAARDHLLELHPKLPVIGAHLASLEFDVKEIAWRLDKYPNFAVDTSARLYDLARQDAAVVREFFEIYSDRVLFGTDNSSKDAAKMTEADLVELKAQFAASYEAQEAYYATDMDFGQGNRATKGIALAPDVLEKLFVTNAETWIPGL